MGFNVALVILWAALGYYRANQIFAKQIDGSSPQVESKSGRRNSQDKQESSSFDFSWLIDYVVPAEAIDLCMDAHCIIDYKHNGTRGRNELPDTSKPKLIERSQSQDVTRDIDQTHDHMMTDNKATRVKSAVRDFNLPRQRQ